MDKRRICVEKLLAWTTHEKGCGHCKKAVDNCLAELDALELTIDELNVVITDVMGAEWNDVAVALIQARDRKRGV